MTERLSNPRVKRPITPMKTWRVGCAALLAIATATLPSQVIAASTGRIVPKDELAVRAAIDRLNEAGNYSWEESVGYKHANPQPDPLGILPTGPLAPLHYFPKATGETVMGGYTTAMLRRRVVMRGSEGVVELSTGWRHAKDLTAEDIAELAKPVMTELRKRIASLPSNSIEQPKSDRQKANEAVVARSYAPALPHEMLRLLMRSATNFHKVGAAIEADVITNFFETRRLESYLRTGVLDPEPSTAGRILRAATSASDEVTKMYVSLNSGLVEEFSVEFARPGMTTIHLTKLTKIGTTTVDPDPEVKALFLDVSAGP